MLVLEVENRVNQKKSAFQALRQSLVPIAMAETLNDLATEYARQAQRQEKQRFDSPTPFIQKSFVTARGQFRGPGQRSNRNFRFARPRRLRAIAGPGYGVSARKLASNTTATQRIQSLTVLQDQGGVRRPYKKALLLPQEKMRLNKYGNIPNKAVQRLKERKDVFIVSKNDKKGKNRTRHLQPGFYSRRKKGNPVILLAFRDRASYNNPPLTLAELMSSTARANTGRLFSKRMGTALRAIRGALSR